MSTAPKIQTSNVVALSVLARPEMERQVSEELRAAVQGALEIEFLPRHVGFESAQIIFVDASDSAALAEISKLQGADRAGRAIFLVVEEGSSVPTALIEGCADDVLVRPFRSVEVLSKIVRSQHIVSTASANALMWDEVNKVNASFSEIVEKLQEDFKLAERLQKTKLPERFPEVKGFKVGARYLAGMRSGGDHFDIAESPSAQTLSMVLSDSSSYGLSSSFLSVLMRVAVKLAPDEAVSSVATVKRIQDELAAVLGERDKLSLFYGVVSRKDYRLRYMNLGTSSVAYAAPGAHFTLLESHGAPFARGQGVGEIREAELQLEPEGRLVLLSDGFVEALGGRDGMLEFLRERRKIEVKDVLNELAFRIKGRLSDDEMPEQDCTAAIFDIDGKILRLAR